MFAKPSEAMHPCLVSETTGFKGTEKLMTARQVVDLWPDAGLTRSQLWRWAREGLIPAVKYPSGRVRFRREDIEALLTPEVAPAGGRSGGGASAGEEPRSNRGRLRRLAVSPVIAYGRRGGFLVYGVGSCTPWL